jgi:cytochrome c oxidase subunit 4
MAYDQRTASAPKQRHKTEGPRNHYIAYLISIILTMLSFAIVIYGGLDKMFLVVFLVGLAIVQIIFQLSIWMHMKERGHVFPIVGLAFGAFVAASGVIAALYWMWW